MYYVYSLLCNFFVLSVVWLYYRDFFVEKKGCRVIKILLGLIRVIVTFAVSEIVHIPIITFVVNIGCLLLITYTYEAPIVRKIFGSCVVGLIGALCDYLSYLFFTAFLDYDNAYNVGYIFTIILFWLTERILANILKKNRDGFLGFKGTGILMVVPISTMIVLVVLTYTGLSGKYVSIIVLALLVICLMTFYIYHFMLENIQDDIDKKILKQQVEGYQREMKRVEESELRLEGLRHDLRHHIIELKDKAENGKTEELLKYLNEMENDIPGSAKYSRSGKYEIDSLVNYILGEAESQLKDLNVNIKLPEDLDINIYKLNVVLGNILENAVRGAKNSDEKKLDLYMDVRQGALYIEVANSYSGELSAKNGELISTQKGKEKHGLGLKNVRRIIQDQDGEMTIAAENNIFDVKILMYL